MAQYLFHWHKKWTKFKLHPLMNYFEWLLVWYTYVRHVDFPFPPQNSSFIIKNCLWCASFSEDPTLVVCLRTQTQLQSIIQCFPATLVRSWQAGCGKPSFSLLGLNDNCLPMSSSCLLKQIDLIFQLCVHPNRPMFRIEWVWMTYELLGGYITIIRLKYVHPSSFNSHVFLHWGLLKVSSCSQRVKVEWHPGQVATLSHRDKHEILIFRDKHSTM